MRQAGVDIQPFFKVSFPMLSSRLNWRNHRKIVVIDGKVGYIGGMNIADRYITRPRRASWRLLSESFSNSRAPPLNCSRLRSRRLFLREIIRRFFLEMIDTVLSNPENPEVIAEVRARVNALMADFPIFA